MTEASRNVDRYTIQVEKIDGTWIVTSPQFPGMKIRSERLELAVKAWADVVEPGSTAG